MYMMMTTLGETVVKPLTLCRALISSETSQTGASIFIFMLKLRHKHPRALVYVCFKSCSLYMPVTVAQKCYDGGSWSGPHTQVRSR